MSLAHVESIRMHSLSSCAAMGAAPSRSTLRKRYSRGKGAYLSGAYSHTADIFQKTSLKGATGTSAHLFNERCLVLARWLRRLSEVLPGKSLNEGPMRILKAHLSGARAFAESVYDRCCSYRCKDAHAIVHEHLCGDGCSTC